MTEQFEDSRTLQETSMDPKLKLGTKSTIKKVLLFVLTGFVIVASVWVSILYLGNQKEAGNNRFVSSQSQLLYEKEKNENVDLTILLEQLSSKNNDIREDGKNRIIQLAHQSTENRKIVADELLRRVQVPDFKSNLVNLSGSFFWESASGIFAELKVTEAIDFLTECLDCPAIHRYASNRYHHKPAVPALIVMGQPAVPQLSKRLSDVDPLIRVYAAVCLGNIGGESARNALSDAMNHEQDLNVRQSMKNSLDAIDRDRLNN